VGAALGEGVAPALKGVGLGVAYQDGRALQGGAPAGGARAQVVGSLPPMDEGGLC
jgi:hypothetical protein